MNIYKAENIRKWDQFTIENEPVSSIDLMERAAIGCYREISETLEPKSIDIFSGYGNNGGDGLVIARKFAEEGINVHLFVIKFSDQPSQDFKQNFERLPDSVEVTELTEQSFGIDVKSEIVVDAIFGSGLNRPVKGWIGEIIKQISSSDSKIVSIDIPSGLFIENNNWEGEIVRADLTLSFQIPKFCFFFAENDQYVGGWKIIDIGLHKDFKAESIGCFLQKEDVKLKHKGKFDHKGNNGWLHCIAGFENMGGAAILCGKAAMRMGCGYTGITCQKDHFDAVLKHLPEALLSPSDQFEIPSKSKAIAIGPGLGKSDDAKTQLQLALESQLPIVLDADAINIMAEDLSLLDKLPENSILTPHLAELERLIGKFSSGEERLKAQKEFSKSRKVYILQKGAHSKVTSPDGKLWINSTGNPGMATAGMGDVLTGIIGSLLAQGYSPENAATYGMFIHGLAADLAVDKLGEESLMSSDVIEMIPEVVKSLKT